MKNLLKKQLTLWLLVAMAVSAHSTIYTVTDAGNTGAGTLRQAITDANAAVGLDTIVFNITGTGPFTIAPATAFPVINSPVYINGLSQSGSSCGSGIQISVDFSAITNSVGFSFAAGSDGSFVEGMNIYGARDAMTVSNIVGFGVQCCHIGTNITGSDTAVKRNTRFGINFTNTSQMLINNSVISGNRSYNVSITGGDTLTVTNCKIGTDLAGNLALGGTAGVRSSPALTKPLTNVLFNNNVISGIAGEAVLLYGVQRATFSNNMVGTNAAGTAALTNTGNGLRVDDVTGFPSFNLTFTNNVVSANQGSGIYMHGADTVTISNNFIGTNAAGTAGLYAVNTGGYFTSQNGILMEGTSFNSNKIVITNNIISGNLKRNTAGTITATYGIYARSVDSIRIQGNRIGTNAAGTDTIPNQTGILIDAYAITGVGLVSKSRNIVIGGPSLSQRNIISGNAGGTAITCSGSENIVIENNYVGTNAAGTAPLYGFRQRSTLDTTLFYPSGQAGIYLTGSTLGRTNKNILVKNNLISGNVRRTSAGAYSLTYGLLLTAVDSATIIGNRIGTNAAGTDTIPNQSGIGMTSVLDTAASIPVSERRVCTNIVVGGPSVAERNIISGNNSNHIYVQGFFTKNITIQNNFIGFNAAGTAVLTAPAAGNSRGINLVDGADSVLITQNRIAGMKNANRTLIATPYAIQLEGNLVNDLYDADINSLATANDGLNKPLIKNVFRSGTSISIEYNADLPAGSYRAEVFNNPAGTGEQAHTYIGAFTFTSAGTGNVVSTQPLVPSSTVNNGDYVTMNFTQIANNRTSALSLGNGKVRPPMTGTENCANGYDDDNDGYADCFDPDCSCYKPLFCDNTLYQGYATTVATAISDSGDWIISRLNSTTGVLTPFCNLTDAAGLDPFLPFNGLASSAVDGFLYVYNAVDYSIYRVDNNGNAAYVSTIWGVNGSFGSPNGCMDILGNYYTQNTVAPYDLYKVNVLTGQATVVVASPTFRYGGDMAFNPLDGRLYGGGSSFIGSADSTVVIDHTGASVSHRDNMCWMDPVAGTFGIIKGNKNPWRMYGHGSGYFDAFGTYYGYNNTAYHPVTDSALGFGYLLTYDFKTDSFSILAQVERTGATDGASCPFNVALGKYSAQDTVKTLDSITYEFSVTNTTASTISGLDFRDVLRNGLLWASTPYDLVNCTVASPNAMVGSNTATFKLNNLIVGKSRFKIKAVVPCGYTGDTAYLNKAYLTGLSNIATFFRDTTASDDTTTAAVLDSTKTIIMKVTVNVQTAISCAVGSGEPVTLDASGVVGGAGGYTYAWSNGQTTPSIVVTPTSNTSVRVTVTDALGCSGADTIDLIVFNLTGGADTVCHTGTLPVTIAGHPSIASYSWYTVGGATITPSTGTSVNINFTTSNKVGSYDTIAMIVNGACGVDTVFGRIFLKGTPTGFTAGNDTSICAIGTSASYAMKATLGNGTGGTWQQFGSAPLVGMNGTTSPNQTLTFGSGFVYNIRWSVSNGFCTVSDTVNLTINSAPTVNAGVDKSRINCAGDSAQIGTAAVSGNTYAWSPVTGLSSATIAMPWAKPTTTTTYLVTVTNTATGCTSTDDVIVNVSNTTLYASAGNDVSVCRGATAPTLGGSPAASNGNPPYVYSWSPVTSLNSAVIANPTVSTATAFASRNYAFMVTDAKGCIYRDTVAVTVNASPTTAPSSTATTICNGQSVTINSNATGGTAPLTYAWNIGSGASHTASPTSNTNFIVTVTDANLCTATGSVAVTVTGSTPLAADAGSARAICNGASTALGGAPTATGGAGGFTYAWASTPAGFTSTAANPTASPTATTTYTLTVTSSGCTATSSVVITVNPRPSLAPAATPSSICNGQSSTIAANATGGTAPLTYTWTGGGSGASFTATPSSTTSYSVTVSDANTCTAVGSVTVNVTGTGPLVANAGSARTICTGVSTSLGGTPTGSGGTGSFTYAWSSAPAGFSNTTANPTLTPTATTTYTVTVTSSGCTATSSVIVTVNPSPTVAPSATATTICNGQSVTINSNATGGTAPLNYAWNNGTGASHTASPTSNTTFIVTVTDNNTCTATGSVSVTVTGSTPLAANAGAARAICNGASTSLGGTPTATGGAGGYTYAWSGGAGTTANPTVTPTATTTYTVTVTSSGCTATSTVVVTVNPTPSLAPSATPAAICNGQSSTIAANATGGTAPLTYTWTGGGSGASFTATPSSTTSYSVTVSDANTCTAVGSVTVNVTGTGPLVANAGSARTICTGVSTSLGGTPTGSGGTGSFTYAWSSAPAGFSNTTANPTLTPTATTTYTVTVTSSGCTATSSVIVTVNPSPTVAPSATATTICNGESVTINANASGGTPSLAYTWNNGAGASHVKSPTANTTYIVTVSDANSCTATGSVSVTVTGSTPLAANAGSARAICNGASTSLGGVPTATGGAGGYTYAWSGGAGTTANPTVTPTATTTYTVTVTSSGCTVSSSVVVTVNPRPTIAPSATPASICNGQSTTVAANATGGTAPLTYTWSPSGTGASFTVTPTSTTPYNPTVSDANGCTVSGSVTVNVTGISPLVANAGTSKTICSGASASLGAVPTATGGSGSYIYAWSGGASAVANPTVSPTTTTTYTVTVTSSGCTATSSVVVNVNPSPTISPSASAATICNGQSVTISANAAGGTAPLSYTWNIGSGASHSHSPTTNTTYQVTTTDANTCTASGSVTVNVTGSTPLAANAGSARAICNGASTSLGGTPTATGGAGGYTYAWSGGAGTTANPTVSPTVTTTYTVTVTSSGCTVSSSVVVTVNPKPSVAPSATPAALCNGQSTNIAANATGGTAPLTYVWGSGSTASSFTATPGSTTAYALTVTDANGCTASGSVTVNVTGTSPLVAVAGSARAICNGGSTTLGGSPTASGGAGGYTYSWSGGAGTSANPVVSPTTTTTYTVTVTSSGCTATSSVVVTVNPRPDVAPSATVTNVCFGGSSTVSANGSGGAAPLTYNWSPSGSGASFVATPNASTIYNVTATDANGCTASGNVSVNVIGSSPLTVNAGTNRTICEGSTTNLGATPTGNGGNTSGSYTYSWSSNPAGFTSTTANPTVSPTATTTYTVTVTNSGCTATNTVVISVNPRPAAAPSASVNPVCSGSNTTITSNASGGTSPYTYQWNTSQTSASFVASPTTTAPIVNAYTVTVTDVNSCTISASVNVNVTPLPVVASIANQSMCIPATGGSVALNAAALTAGQTGAWTTVTSPSGAVSFSAPTAASSNVSTLSPINTYTFRWTLTENGCSNSTTTNVIVNESPVIEAGANDTICLNTSKALSASLTSVSPAAINWKANTISATPFAFTTGVTVAPTATTRYIFTAAISPCIVSDTVIVAVIGVPNLVDDLATCLSATEDLPTTFSIPATIGSNDALALVLRGGVTYKVLSSKNSTATVSGTTLNYASNLNFYGKDTVVIEAYSNECTPLRDTAMFCVDVAGVNDKPVLMADTLRAVGTNPKTFNPLANDSDIETTLKGGNITVLSGPNSGTLTGPTADGTFTYTGNTSNLAILDTIVIEVCDSGLPMPAQCDISRIIVQLVPDVKDSTAKVTPGNPVVIGPAVTTGPGVTMTPKLIGANGTNGTTITTPSGTVTINTVTGVMTFTPSDTPFIGKDTIRKVLCFTYPDGSEACDTSIFVVSNPSVTDSAIDSIPMNTSKVIGTLKPYKFEGSNVTTSTSSNATVDPITGKITYTPKPGTVGIDTVRVTRCDDKGNCVTDVFVVKVTPNLPDSNVTSSGNTPITLGPSIKGENGAIVSPPVLTGPSKGTVTTNADGTVTYTPSGSYVGRDTLTRIVKVTYPDGTVKYDTQTVIVKNTIPDVINPNGDIKVNQDETKIIGTLPVITFEGKPVVTTPTSSNGGKVTVDSNGKVIYTPKPGFFGIDTVKVVRCDNLGNCVTSIFIVTVEEVLSEIANYFSPNGDGINDVWNLDGLLNRYPNAKAIIYNRWGNVVWRSTGPYGRSTSGTNVWFGQAEGGKDNVPDGVYYYLLELEDSFKTSKTGFIEVMRQ